MPRGESNFPFSVLTNSLTTLEESLALAINFEEIDSCGWSILTSGQRKLKWREQANALIERIVGGWSLALIGNDVAAES